MGSLGNGRELKATLDRCLEINSSYMSLGSWSVTAGLAAYDDHVGGAAPVPAGARSQRSTGRMGRVFASALQRAASSAQRRIWRVKGCGGALLAARVAV